MIVTVKTIDPTTGEADFGMKLSHGELNYLVTFALSMLSKMGQITISAAELGEEQVIEIPEINEPEPAEVSPDKITLN